MNAKKKQTAKDSDIAWHPAFFQGIQLELAPYKDFFEYIAEHQLTKEPLRIDVVIIIIRKLKNIPLTKNIVAIFRIYNLVEYKSPTDYLSVADFYKVYAYACLYMAMNKKAINELSLTFVTTGYPRKLLEHLKKVRGYQVDTSVPGIYKVTGDFIPIQIIDSRKLSAAENIWLNSLDNNLDEARLHRLNMKVDGLDEAAEIDAYLNAVACANRATLEEVYNMSKNVVEFDRFLERSGLKAKWEASGKAKGVAEGVAEGVAKGNLQTARNLLAMGDSPEKIAKATGLPLETIKALQP